MNIQQASIILAVVASIGIVVWFLIIATFNSPESDFYYGENKLTRSNIRSSLAATATSLAGALFFFMEQISAFAFILLAIPLLAFIGYKVFDRIVANTSPNPEDIGSIQRLIFWKTKSKPLASASNYIVILNFFAVFLIEIIIGAKIFSYLFGNSPWILIIFSFLLCGIAFLYVIKGGFTAVVFTDRWQLWLLILAYFLVFISIIFLFFNSERNLGLNEVISVFSNPQLGFGFAVMFFINAAVINLTLPSSQISTWQRFSAAFNEKEAKEGFKLGALLFTGFWYLAIITSAFVVTLTDGKAGIDGMFDSLRGGGIFTALIVFPIIFSGLLAALLSTADSFMISSMLAIDDTRKSQSVVARKNMMFLTGTFMTIIAVLAAIAVSFSSNLGRLIIQMLFAAYALPCLLFPLIYFGGVTDISSRINSKGAIISIFAGLLILIVTAGIGMAYNALPFTLLGPVAAVIVSTIGIRICLKPWSIET